VESSSLLLFGCATREARDLKTRGCWCARKTSCSLIIAQWFAIKAGFRLALDCAGSVGFTRGSEYLSVTAVKTVFSRQHRFDREPATKNAAQRRPHGVQRFAFSALVALRRAGNFLALLDGALEERNRLAEALAPVLDDTHDHILHFGLAHRLGAGLSEDDRRGG
jgi:hypothetical protein